MFECETGKESLGFKPWIPVLRDADGSSQGSRRYLRAFSAVSFPSTSVQTKFLSHLVVDSQVLSINKWSGRTWPDSGDNGQQCSLFHLKASIQKNFGGLLLPSWLLFTWCCLLALCRHSTEALGFRLWPVILVLPLLFPAECDVWCAKKFLLMLAGLLRLSEARLLWGFCCVWVGVWRLVISEMIRKKVRLLEGRRRGKFWSFLFSRVFARLVPLCSLFSKWISYENRISIVCPDRKSVV